MGPSDTLGDAILALYARGEFGKVLKAEIDAVVFHHALLAQLPAGFVANGRVSYLKIGKHEIRALSLALRLSEARVSAFLERDFLLYGKSEPIGPFLLELVNSHNLRKEMLLSGKLRFVIGNPIARKDLEERIVSLGGIPDYSFNRDLLAVDVYDFLRLVGTQSDDQIREVIVHNLLAKAVVDSKSLEYQAFSTELARLPVADQLRRLAQGFGEQVLGKAADQIVAQLFHALGF
jgi:hypothetical protein